MTDSDNELLPLFNNRSVNNHTSHASSPLAHPTHSAGHDLAEDTSCSCASSLYELFNVMYHVFSTAGILVCTIVGWDNLVNQSDFANDVLPHALWPFLFWIGWFGGALMFLWLVCIIQFTTQVFLVCCGRQDPRDADATMAASYKAFFFQHNWGVVAYLLMGCWAYDIRYNSGVKGREEGADTGPWIFLGGFVQFHMLLVAAKFLRILMGFLTFRTQAEGACTALGYLHAG